MPVPLNIKVIGAGGIGGCLLLPLARWLNFCYTGSELTIIDGDTFEQKNRERQLADRLDNKALTVARRLASEFPNTRVLAQSVYVTGDNALDLLHDGDIIMSCVDNHRSRRLISDAVCQLPSVLTISGGNFLTDGNVQIHHRSQGEDLTLPVANHNHPEIMEPKDKHPEEMSCTERYQSEPQLLFMNNSIAAKMLEIVLAYTNGAELPDEVYIDIVTFMARPKRYKRAAILMV